MSSEIYDFFEENPQDPLDNSVSTYWTTIPIEVNQASEKAYNCEWLSTAGYGIRA